MSIVDLFLFPHFIFILIGIILLSLSLFFVNFHKPKKWFLLHWITAIGGTILAIIGIILLGTLILTIPHGIVGLLAIIFLVYAVVVGIVARNLKNKNLRKAHIWTSRVIYVFSLIALILGILSFI
ncbi:MAG: hypothetical protein ACFFBY_04095 [Promethearchaeota archaeon]